MEKNNKIYLFFKNENLNLGQRLSNLTDIRKNPSIKLKTILMSILLMPFYNISSLLGLDIQSRKKAFKKLFGCSRNQVVSDSTASRVLNWLNPQESEEFLLGFKDVFVKEKVNRIRLVEHGPLRKIGILDGTQMGSHWTCVLNLCGKVNYPVMFLGYKKRGKELPTAQALLKKAQVKLGPQGLDLLLVDALYFNKPFFDAANNAKVKLLIKCENSDFRNTLKDARFFINAKDMVTKKVTEIKGFDSKRCCAYTIKVTSGEFASYPVLIAHVVEDYPKRKKDNHVEFWIITTDLSLSPEEMREAAHLRWQIENNLFKRLSHHAGTKRFHFKEPKPFYNMLCFFYAALLIYALFIYIMEQDERDFKRFCAGIKRTWKALFSLIEESYFEEGLFLALL